MISLDIYSRRGCHLCEVLIEEAMELSHGRFMLLIHDIDTQPDLKARYDTRVPVVEHNGQLICEYRLDKEKVLELLRQPPPSSCGS